MTIAVELAEIAALIGDPARANILSTLMDGAPRTATELAFCAGVTPQTASWHLSSLSDGGLLAYEKQGRNRYYRLASPQVAQMLEKIMSVAARGRRRYRPPSKLDDAMREARLCYDHLAGRLGVAVTGSLVRSRHVVLAEEGARITARGGAFLGDFGVDLAQAKQRRRSFCRPCLDWSEQRPHLAGAVGAALADRCFSLGWIRRTRDSRALILSEAGRDGFARVFGITFT